MTRKIIVIIALVLLASLFCVKMLSNSTQSTPAHYASGQTIIVRKYNVGPRGGIFTVEGTKSPIENLKLEIPPESLKKEVIVSLGYNEGILTVNSGRASGIVVVLEVSDNVTSFQEPFKISATLDVSSNSRNVLGYSIESNGKLRPIDTKYGEPRGAVAQFFTFKPLMFTWVYLEK